MKIVWDIYKVTRRCSECRADASDIQGSHVCDVCSNWCVALMAIR